jgi:hypothetical protein
MAYAVNIEKYTDKKVEETVMIRLLMYPFSILMPLTRSVCKLLIKFVPGNKDSFAMTCSEVRVAFTTTNQIGITANKARKTRTV